jgi:biopolymer transport protein ExbD
MYKTKLKISRNLSVDTASLCDVSFLILVFFISVSHFEQWEPLKIETPIASKTNVCTAYTPFSNAIIYIADNKVMFQYTGDDGSRKLALSAMAKKYAVRFSPDEQETFLRSPIIGQLFDWVLEARKAEVVVNHKALLVTIKADKDVSYTIIKQVISILQKQRINKFSLETNSKSSAI